MICINLTYVQLSVVLLVVALCVFSYICLLIEHCPAIDQRHCLLIVLKMLSEYLHTVHVYCKSCPIAVLFTLIQSNVLCLTHVHVHVHVHGKTIFVTRYKGIHVHVHVLHTNTALHVSVYTCKMISAIQLKWLQPHFGIYIPKF